MTPDQWARVKDLFHAALDVALEERADFVADACGGDAAVQAEVERLLAAQEEAGQFLEQRPPGASSRQSMTGQTLGRYEIGRLIGTGGMGEVYAASDRELKREVAIKIGLAADAGPRLRREAQHASGLNHPHICTIHEVGSSEGRTYIVMEYVAGQCLRDVIPLHGLPLPDVLRYGVQIADALGHAHDHGVTHRDLKTANIVLTSDGRAKVLDFGLARAMATRQTSGLSEPPTVTAPGILVGTLAYMAPELLRGEPANASTDIWSLGVVLYEMASGARPFAGTTEFGLTGSILHEQPAALPPGVPRSLQQVIAKCLAKDPRARYATAHEVRAALEEARTDRHDSRRTDGTVTGNVRHGLLSRQGALLAAGLALVVAAGAVAVWALRASSPVGVGASGRPAIAVMSFDNLAGGPETAWLSKGIPSMLLTGLAQTRGLDIVSIQRLREVVREMGGTELETTPREQFAEIAERAGAGAVIVGAISKAGSDIRIDAQMEDLSTGRILAAQSVRGSDLFLLVDQLTTRIRDDIGLRDATEIRKLSDISTTSIEAFQLYTQALDAFVSYRWDEARPLLERAVAIDPGFADAYLHLAHTNFFLGILAFSRSTCGRLRTTSTGWARASDSCSISSPRGWPETAPWRRERWTS